MKSKKSIPLFPLNICLLPGEDIPLRIFEPRYKQLINDCDAEKFSFGIPYICKNEMMFVGTEVKLNQIIAKNSHGEMVIMVEAISNFELVKFHKVYHDRLYSGGDINTLDERCIVTDDSLLKLICEYTGRMDSEFLKGNRDLNCIPVNDLAKSLNLSSDDKYSFLSIRENSKRELFLKKQIEYLFKLREQEKLLNNDFYLN